MLVFVRVCVCSRVSVCGPYIILGLDVSALANERVDHIEVPLLAGEVEGRPSTLHRRRQDAA